VTCNRAAGVRGGITTDARMHLDTGSEGDSMNKTRASTEEMGGPAPLKW
jgi:hypothetical protein